MRRAVSVLFLVISTTSCGSTSEAPASIPPEAGTPGDAQGGWDGGDALADQGGGTDGTEAAPCEPEPLDGLYDVQGSDALGAYTGRGEISGTRFVRAITYSTYKASDGVAVAQVMEGTAGPGTSALDLQFKLDRVGFITAAGGLTREGMSKAPALAMSGTLQPAGCNRYQGVLAGSDTQGTVEYAESWQRTGDVGAATLWQNQRVEILTQDTADSSWLLQFFVPEEYANSEKIAPYKDRPEFQQGIALAIFDPTDFDYYRAPDNAEVYRVIQKPVDAISIAEASVRATAYRSTLTDKEKFFAGDAPRAGDVQKKGINEYGMMSHWSEADQDYYHDGDALLWTGVYASAMAMKFLETGDAVALQQMLKSLDGTIKCLEITGSNTEFARTIRRYIDNRTYDVGDPSEWVRGIGSFSDLEWKVNGNNDMSKGFLTAYLWTSLAMAAMTSAEASEAAALYGDLYQRMFDTLQRLRDNHALYQWSTGDVTNLPAWYAANITLKVIADLAPGIADNAVTVNPLHWPMLKQVYEQGLSYINEGGVSDWSGNHLGILGDLNLFTAFLKLGMTANADDLAGFIGDGDKKMKRHRLGFFQVVAGTLGNPKDPDNVQDGLWVLKEMSIPKATYPIDWQQHPDFCMSPNPELVWKMDWKTNDRSQSIRAYALFERPPSSYAWKDNPYRQYAGQGDAAWTGHDFLIAYWFARRAKVLTEAD